MKLYWYSIHVRVKNPYNVIDELNFYSGFENKNITLKDIRKQQITPELGKVKDNTCCICSVSYLGKMTREEFIDGSGYNE